MAFVSHCGTYLALIKSQVAVDRTSPGGRVIGIDIIPAQPPRGVSTIQGNFLSKAVQREVKSLIRDPTRGRPLRENLMTATSAENAMTMGDLGSSAGKPGAGSIGAGAPQAVMHDGAAPATEIRGGEETVDVVLSDMSAPWQQTSGFWKRSLSDPYHRMMNTSGNGFRDHVGR